MLNLKSIIENDISLEQKVDQIILLLNQQWSAQQVTSQQIIGQVNNHSQLIQSILSEMQSNYHVYWAALQEFAKRLKERDELIEKLNKHIMSLEKAEE